MADTLSLNVGNGQVTESKRISPKDKNSVNRVASDLKRNMRISVYSMVM